MSYRLDWLRSRIVCSWWGRILAEHDTEPTEFAGGVLKLALGIWLAFPFSTVFSSPTFRVMQVAPEWGWATLLISIGTFHLWALRGGYIRWRWAASTIGFVVWFSLASMFLVSNIAAIGWILFMGAAAAQCWVSIRLGLLK